MNKRYIDFVPTAKATAAPKKNIPRKTGPVMDGVVARPKTARRATFAVRAKQVEPVKRTRRVTTRVGASKPEKTEVAKIKTATAVKVSDKTTPVAFTDEKKKKNGGVEDLSRHFVKTEVAKRPLSRGFEVQKTEKRPLSGTVYKKKVVVPKEEKQEPVTIITKPEKQSSVGVIVAVILTIILGAAAGTVAFLLLPK